VVCGTHEESNICVKLQTFNLKRSEGKKNYLRDLQFYPDAMIPSTRVQRCPEETALADSHMLTRCAGICTFYVRVLLYNAV
jgi:hypothetical protein